jgi:hypothetical protein
LSRIVNNSNMAAVHQTLQVHHVHQQQVIQQNMRMQRQLILQVAQQVTATPVTVEDIRELAEISRTAESQGLDFAQVMARIQESTPFATLIELLPRDRAELYALLAVLLAVLELVLSQRPQPEVKVVSPEQVEQIIGRVIEHQDQQPEPPPSTAAPDCDQDPHGRKGKRP